jgi:DNA-binding CsgD family transcriptional regulator
VFAPEGAVVVTLEEVRPQPLSDEQLRVRYNLTRREVQVARLVERGRSTPEIARALGVSTHTARHHVEHLRSKLGCHRAAEAGAALRAH